MNRTCRVGVHGRNDPDFHEADYVIIREAKIEALKMMSQTKVDHFRRLKELRRDIELITRLYDDRFGKHGHPSPEEFAARMVPVMQSLQPYSTKFEIHNEPNHLDRIEGWGDRDDDARDFNAWFLRVYDILKGQCPWAQLGFPGLAIPHRDLEWVEICRPAVEKSDWLGVHCYWQTPPQAMHNHLADGWGLRFKHYHQKFPNKIIDLTEVGNSNVQNNIPFTRESHAREFVEYLTECFKYPYLNSAAFFIMSSPDRTWDGFAWRNESGQIYPITYAIRDMPRPFWTQAAPAAPRPAAAPPAAQPAAAQPAATPALAAAQPAATTAIPPAVVSQLQQLQSQNSQLQTQLRQLQTQQAQLQVQIQQIQQQNAQLQAQPSAVAGSPAATPMAPPMAPPPLTPQAPAPAVQNIADTLARNPAQPLPARSLNQIERIIIHHTAVPPAVGAGRIAEFLVNKGRSGISYHYFIAADGQIQQTNDLTVVTGQSEPQFNLGAIGIGFAGDFTNTSPTPAQIESGAQLIAWLLRQFNLPAQAVFAHKELVNTQSPGVQWDQGARWGAQLGQRVQALLAG
jgi:hypothetical protein